MDADQFFEANGLAAFARRHRPSLAENLQPYLAHRKLSEYTLATRETLVPREIYVRYVKRSTAFTSRHLGRHIRTGGFLLALGRQTSSGFIVSEGSQVPTHLRLCFAPSPIPDEDGIMVKAAPRIFVVTISKCYLFVKRCRHVDVTFG